MIVYVDDIIIFPSVCSSTFNYGFYTVRIYSGTNANPNNLNESFRVLFTDPDGNVPRTTFIDSNFWINNGNIIISVNFSGNICKFDHWGLSFGDPLSISNDIIIVDKFDLLAFKDINRLNIFSRIISSINYLIWGDV